MQVPENEEVGLGEQSEECPTDDHEASPSPVVRSTKLPTKHTSTMTKRQKRELQEDIVLQRAVSCMEKVEQNVPRATDGDDVFGQYVASELKSIDNPRITK